MNEVLDKFKMFKQATGGTLFFDIHEVYADDTHAASFVTLTADHPDHPDRHMNVKEVNIFHLDANGRAYEFWGIPEDEAERDSFWADDRTAEEKLEAAKTALGLPALLASKATGGSISMLKVHLPPGRMLAPVHTHVDQDEASYILEGELSFYLAGEVHRFKAGDTAYKPKGVPHTIFNDTDAPASFIELCWPGGLDEYLEDMAVVLSSGGPPDFKRIAEIQPSTESSRTSRASPRLARSPASVNSGCSPAALHPRDAWRAGPRRPSGFRATTLLHLDPGARARASGMVSRRYARRSSPPCRDA